MFVAAAAFLCSATIYLQICNYDVKLNTLQVSQAAKAKRSYSIIHLLFTTTSDDEEKETSRKSIDDRY